jgi:outer membrane immunogenic protein
MVDIRNAAKVSSTTWAAVAAAAAAGTSAAGAADMAPYAKAPPPVPTWQGLYVGGSVGATWLKSTQDDTAAIGGVSSFPFGSFGYSSTTGGSSGTANGLGWLGGLNLGYNLQSGNFVYGAEVDFSWLGSTKATSNGSFSSTTGYTGFGGVRYSAPGATSRTSQVNGLATFRARVGIDFGGTLPYLTGGLALGDIKNSYTISGQGYNGSVNSATVAKQSWVPGIVLGGGIEHKLSERWTLRGEIMWVGFQDKQLNNPLFSTAYGGLTSTAGPIKFSNELTTAKIGLNYRF